ncbi:MAG TPA: hypothetical protein PLD49_05225 [Thermoclostridium caenicola]|uniref:Zonular occludens toxin (Zot) n=1 Tax=Thermoclostridium caenicola TaxID=659425 RepID=A0A1M6IPS5_9FIRM|nr:hypothetical protein [Thermoclostridium caenicola]HPU45869.1 hypothetical protein [Thermoclostridium sp.]SHJ36456.1 hypothetical protein SAMN05444373_10466 [Thermoclostridium caenicola]HOK43046.1 hypothetical protein [Thermoclostridium caenicola]HOL83859.1 hypothetical protein [Thermoclostridium caenicola]HOP73172.1 hypothetical protein [Thermoclostridium caenicola]
MIKVVCGGKGIGKTKYLIADANNMLNDCLGEIVFINHDNSLMHSLKHQIRYVNTSDFPVKGINEIFAMICGIIAENYDVKAIYMDGLGRHVQNPEETAQFFEKIKELSEKYSVKFVFSMSGDISGIPDFVQKEFTC